MGLLSYEGMGSSVRAVRMPVQAAVIKGFSKTVAACVSINDFRSFIADIDNKRKQLSKYINQCRARC
jgi:hypothetical protein